MNEEYIKKLEAENQELQKKVIELEQKFEKIDGPVDSVGLTPKFKSGDIIVNIKENEEFTIIGVTNDYGPLFYRYKNNVDYDVFGTDCTKIDAEYKKK